MTTDMKRIIPDYTLPRWNSNKKLWLKKEKLKIEEDNNYYIIFYGLKRNSTGLMSYGISVPKTIILDERFKFAIVAYMCEGTKPSKGRFTKCSGNKGRSIQFSNQDLWLVRLIIDEFEKIGIMRPRWKIYLTLFGQHKEKEEIEWWKKNLKIKQKFNIIRLEGDPPKGILC
jgi:hypothetical protein